MWNLTYLELLERIFNLHFEFLCPWRDLPKNPKLRKLFCASFVSPFILVLTMTSFIYLKWDTLSFTRIAENIATALCCARSIGYSVLVKEFYFKYRTQVAKLLDDRKSLPFASKELSTTERYCKTEIFLILSLHLSCLCIMLLILYAFVYFFPNDYQLPFNCYMFFLPPDGFLFAWELNYLVLSVTTSLAGFVIAFYLPILFAMMNQSCWLSDMALITAQDINYHLQLDEDIRNPERIAKTNEKFKKFTERCEKFVEWQSEVQDLLSWYFNLEFQVQSLMLCFSIYVLSFTFSGVVLIELIFCAIQTFLLCWMGSRVTGRIDQLSFEIGKNWYLMTPSQRKALQMTLHWTQNMKGFSGLFSDVSLETCKVIFDASYSFYTFLQSTNGN